MLCGVFVECGCHWSFPLNPPLWAPTEQQHTMDCCFGQDDNHKFMDLFCECLHLFEQELSHFNGNGLFLTPPQSLVPHPFTVSLSSSPLKHTAVIVMANPECESRFHFPFPLFHCFLFAIVSFDFSTVPTLHKTTSNQPSTLLLHCVLTDFSFLFLLCFVFHMSHNLFVLFCCCVVTHQHCLMSPCEHC